MAIIQPFAFTNLIFVAILSYFIFSEIITVPTMIGGIIIIMSTSFIAYNEHKNHKRSLAYKIAKDL